MVKNIIKDNVLWKMGAVYFSLWALIDIAQIIEGFLQSDDRVEQKWGQLERIWWKHSFNSNCFISGRWQRKQWFITHFVSMHADKCSTDNNNDTQHDCVYIWWKVQADESKSYNRLYSESAPSHVSLLQAQLPHSSNCSFWQNFTVTRLCHQHICQTTTFVVCILVCIIYSNCLLDTNIFGYSF